MSAFAEMKLAEEIGKLKNKILLKNSEIEKRKEILSTYIDSDTNKDKTNNKVEKIYSKILDLSGNCVNSINYYKEQITKAEEIYDRENTKLEMKRDKAIEKAKAVYEEAVKNAETSYEINQRYLQDKKDSNVKAYETNIIRISEKIFEKSSTLIEKTNIISNAKPIDENGDKLLIKLKFELKQLQEQLEDNEKYEKELVLERLKYQNKLQEQIKMEALREEQAAYNKAKEQAYYIKQAKEDDEKKHQEKLQELKITNPETFMTVEDKKQAKKAFTKKLKDFKAKFNNVLNSYIVKENYLEDNKPCVDEHNLLDYFNKSELEYIVELSSDNDIKSFCDSKIDVYTKKQHFEETSIKQLNEMQNSIYTNLLLLTKDDDIYHEFFELQGIDKQKKFLNKYQKEYEFSLRED